MKKRLLLIPAVAFLFTVNSCKKELPPAEVSNMSTTYKPVLFKFSATWCGACGSQGYPAFKDIFEQHGNKISVIAFNRVDAVTGIIPPGSTPIWDFLEIPFTPNCAVNVGEQFYPWTSSINNRLADAVAEHPKAKAGIGFSLKVEGDNAIITTKTVAFEALTGRYNVAVYLTEDGIVEDQLGIQGDPTITHNHIVRGLGDTLTWGAPIITNSCEKGAIFSRKFTVAIPSDVRNRNNLHPVVVLYKMDPATLTPVDVINSNND